MFSPLLSVDVLGLFFPENGKRAPNPFGFEALGFSSKSIYSIEPPLASYPA
jgi:hypothetical protein